MVSTGTTCTINNEPASRRLVHPNTSSLLIDWSYPDTLKFVTNTTSQSTNAPDKKSCFRVKDSIISRDPARLLTGACPVLPPPPTYWCPVLGHVLSLLPSS